METKKQIIVRAISTHKEERLRDLVDRIGETNRQELFMLRDKPRGKEILKK